MLRDLNEISDGKVYGKNDTVRLACNNCRGCSYCCEGMGESVVLDPFDIFMLSRATGKNFEELQQNVIALHIEQGMILPHLNMQGRRECCTFLDDAGRCSVHAYRPGLCRTFPLGRIYEDNSIRYFLQKEGCIRESRSKVKIVKWLEMPGYKQYEDYLLAWHALRKNTEDYAAGAGERELKQLNLFLLNHFFVKPYEEGDFYAQFYDRLSRACDSRLFA